MYSADLHPLCVGQCTPTQLGTVRDICIVDILLALLWYAARGLPFCVGAIDAVSSWRGGILRELLQFSVLICGLAAATYVVAVHCRVGGEFMIRKFDLELAADLAGGRERQKRMNKRDKIDIDAIVKSVRHSWQWNDELEGWKERRNMQKERCGGVCQGHCCMVGLG